MNQPDLDTWKLLEKNNLVEGEFEVNDDMPSPWYVKVLAAFSGWLASIFILGFVGMGFEPIFDNVAAMLIVGGLMIGGSAYLLQHPKNEFIEHISLAISLAGQILIVIAFFEFSSIKDKFAWFLIAAFQVPLAFYMPNYLHRFFSSFAAIMSLSISFSLSGSSQIFIGLLMIFCAWLWLNEFNYSKQIKKIQAIGYGSVIALISLKSTLLFGGVGFGLGSTKLHNEFWSQSWLGELLGGIAMLYVIIILLKRNQHKLTDPLSLFAIVSTIAITVLSIKAQGLTVGIMILVLGFSASNLVLQGLGTLSLLFYISAYYYFLQNTLLDKSQTLLFIGFALLLVRWLFLHFVPEERSRQQ